MRENILNIWRETPYRDDRPYPRPPVPGLKHFELENAVKTTDATATAFPTDPKGNRLTQETFTVLNWHGVIDNAPAGAYGLAGKGNEGWVPVAMAACIDDAEEQTEGGTYPTVGPISLTSSFPTSRGAV